MGSKISNIVVLGANGQVGTEVCLYLKHTPDVDVTAIVRSGFSAAILERLNIKCLSGDIISDDKIKAAITEADVVFDLAGYATGSVGEVNAFYSARLKIVIACMRKGSNYVFASSMNALGFSSRSPRLRYHMLASSIYCSSKRYAEKLSMKLGKMHNVNVFVFRLGEVHGVIQRSTAVLRKLINEGYSFIIPDTPSWTIFTYSIAESLVSVSNKLEEPGIYMLVSPYEWSWDELLIYIASKDKKSVATTTIFHRTKGFNYYFSFAKRAAYMFLLDRRDLFRANFSFMDKYVSLIKLKRAIGKVEMEISINKKLLIYTDLARYIGRVPGKRIKSISDIKKTIAQHEKIIEDEFKKLV